LHPVFAATVTLVSIRNSAMTRATIGLDDKTYAYLLQQQPPEHPLLVELRALTSVMPRARMQIAPEQGHFLAFLCRTIGARRVLEVGTFTGYSALAMALALPHDGRIVACDVSAEWTAIGRGFWAKAGVADKIELRLGPAVATLQQLEREGAGGSFDLAFVDANKEDYDAYYECALRLVRVGGVIALDNVLRGGRVADLRETDRSVAAIRELNTRIASDERVDRVMLPVGDGMTLARRR
jgi:O-methyltransferase